MEQYFDHRSEGGDAERPARDGCAVHPGRAHARKRKQKRPHRLGESSRTLRNDAAPVVRSDLPHAFPVLSSEVALLRCFLADEIDAILHAEE
jgi:hypothetical protein